MIITNIDLVNAKSGKVLKSYEKVINKISNILLSILIYTIIVSFLIFWGYYSYKKLTFFLNN